MILFSKIYRSSTSTSDFIFLIYPPFSISLFSANQWGLEWLFLPAFISFKGSQLGQWARTPSISSHWWRIFGGWGRLIIITGCSVLACSTLHTFFWNLLARSEMINFEIYWCMTRLLQTNVIRFLVYFFLFDRQLCLCVKVMKLFVQLMNIPLLFYKQYQKEVNICTYRMYQ